MVGHGRNRKYGALTQQVGVESAKDEKDLALRSWRNPCEGHGSARFDVDLIGTLFV